MAGTPSTPRGACDCHMHIYEEAYPLAASATFKPPNAPLSAYRQVQRALGLERTVLVQATGYGFDNRCLMDALAQLGESARGIVVVPVDVSDAELLRLHRLGVRGVRYMMLAGSGGVLPWDTMHTMAARIAPLGWNINLQLDGRELPLYKSFIDALPGKVVIDHTGKFIEPVTPDSPAFKALLSVLDQDGRWVKLSGPYETSKGGAPHYDDVSLLAKALLNAHPDRCLWASNWPHPNTLPVPSDAMLLALLDEWVAGAGPQSVSLRHRVLVDNPVTVYGF